MNAPDKIAALEAAHHEYLELQTLVQRIVERSSQGLQVRPMLSTIGDASPAPHHAAVLAWLHPRLRYTTPLAVVHTIDAYSLDVDVIGDPENAAYEWVVRDGDHVLRHSNAGYGSPAPALRDGLIAALGAPDEPGLLEAPLGPGALHPERQPA